MANYWGRLNAPMVQPTKDELRQWLREARHELEQERGRRENAETKLAIATEALGVLVLQGKIQIPVKKLGELALQIATKEWCELGSVKLLEKA